MRWTDPTGETIVENVDDKYKENYEKWKKALLSTKAGQALWNKYDKDKNFTLKITVSEKRGNGALTDSYTFDSNGNLNGATITLGSKLGQEAPPENLGYLVTGSLTETDSKRVGGTLIDSLTRAVGKFAHEFGHVKDAQARPAFFQLLQQYNQRAQGLSQQQLQTDPELNRLRNQLGGDMNRVDYDNEARADSAAVPVLQERFGKNMPARVKDAMKKMQDYQKAHP